MSFSASYPVNLSNFYASKATPIIKMLLLCIVFNYSIVLSQKPPPYPILWQSSIKPISGTIKTCGNTYFLSFDGSNKLKSSLYTNQSFQLYSLNIKGVSFPTTIGKECSNLYFEFYNNFSITGLILISKGKGLYEEITIS